MAYSVSQNTAFLTGASVLQKIISFAYFTLVARSIGVENTGHYFFAISFTTIFTVVADFGFGPVLTRETARHPENSQKYINTILLTKFVFGALAYGLIFLAINILGYDSEVKLLVYVSGLTMLFDNLQSCFFSTFRARKNLIFESVAVVLSQTMTMIIGTLVIINHWPLVFLIVAYTVPSALIAIYGAFWLHRHYRIRYAWQFDWQIFRSFVAMALPFALAGILSRLYAYVDTVIISKFLGATHLGWWSVPYKITYAFQFVPVALAASAYPVFSTLVERKEEAARLFEKSWKYLFLIVFPISFGMIAIARPVVLKLYGVLYEPSIIVLQVLMVSLIFSFLALITGALLNATNHQRWQTGLVGMALTTNVILNIVLLPRIGILGAAVAALVGNVILCVGGYVLVNRVMTLPHWSLTKYFVATGLSAGIMAAVAWCVVAKFNFLWAIAASVTVYGFLLWFFKIVSVDMIKEWKISLGFK